MIYYNNVAGNVAGNVISNLWFPIVHCQTEFEYEFGSKVQMVYIIHKERKSSKTSLKCYMLYFQNS